MNITVLHTIEIQVAGSPKAQPRIRARAVTPPVGEAYARVYTPEKAAGWKDKVYLAALSKKLRQPFEGPMKLSADFFFARPKSLLKKSSPAGVIPHTTKPDRDNLDKAVMDALGIKGAGVFKDDCQAYDGQIRKWYVAKGAQPGVIIRIEFHAFEDAGQMRLGRVEDRASA